SRRSSPTCPRLPRRRSSLCGSLHRLRRDQDREQHHPGLLPGWFRFGAGMMMVAKRPQEAIPMSSDPLPNLDTFTRAAELSSFTAAAKALGLAQAAVSQRIQALEQALNVSLFARQGGRVLLTEAGHRLYPYAQRILALEREALQEV